MNKIFDKFFIGINYWASKNATRMWRDYDPEVIENDMRLLQQAGVTVLRVFPLWEDFQPLTAFPTSNGVIYDYGMKGEPRPDTPAGKAGVDEVMCGRFESFCQIADKYGMTLIVGLLTGHMSFANFIPPALVNLNLVSNATAVRWEIKYLTYIVNRFKNIDNIVAWDLGNEIEALRNNNTRDEFYVWCVTLANTIRSCDRSRPLVSGIGRFEVEKDYPNLFDLADACDINTVHLYNIFHSAGDPVNTMVPVLDNVFKCQLSEDVGKMPTFLQEFGATGYTSCSKKTEMEFYRATVLSILSHGYKGTMYWCAFDQGHLTIPPYNWNNIGSDYGFYDRELNIKPIAKENIRLKSLIDLIGNDLPKHRINCTIIDPRDEGGLQLSTMKTAYYLAKRANLDPMLAYALDKLPDSDLYIMPSLRYNKAITNTRLNELLERVNNGATLYISLAYAHFRSLPDLAGVCINSRSIYTNQVKINLGDTVLPVTGVIDYDISEGTSEVIAKDDRGMPIFVKNRYGKGNIYVLFAPIEEYLSQTHGSFCEEGRPDYERIYRILAENVRDKKISDIDSKFIRHTEHICSDGSILIFAINYSSAKNTAQLLLDEDYELSVVWGNSLQGRELELEPCDGILIKATKKV